MDRLTDREAGWAEDVPLSSSRRSQAGGSTVAVSSSAALTGASKAYSIASTRLLTDEDFRKLRALQAGDMSVLTAGRRKAVRTAPPRESALVSEPTIVDESKIASFTAKKRAEDREIKIAEARAKRSQNTGFNVHKKRKTKLIATHTEKQKHGKLFQMTKRSGRVAAKLRRSADDRVERKKTMKTKDVKFRLARGWKV